MPENEMQIIDQMEIYGEERQENEIVSIDKIEIISSYIWITQPSEEDKFTILREEKPEKPENIIQNVNELILSGEEKPENVVEERDAMIIPGLEKSENQIEYIDELLRNQKMKYN